MSRRLLLTALLFVNLTLAPSTASSAPTHTFPFRNWISYYGGGRIDELKNYDFVDLDASDDGGGYSAADIAMLKAQLGPRGGKVVSYLNLGSCEKFRSYWEQCRQFAVGKYRGYPDERWMDLTDSAYRDFVLTVQAPALAAKGVDGFYYDNLDIYQEAQAGRLRRDGQTLSAAPVKQGLADLLRALRQQYPSLLLVAQNGVYADTDPGPEADNLLYWPDAHNSEMPVWRYVDAEAHEDVNAAGETERNAIFASLHDLKSKGLPIFLLDYPGKRKKAQQWSNRGICQGFLPLVAKRSLKSTVPFPDTRTPPAPTQLQANPDGSTINLSWTGVPCDAPGDDYGVASYRVYRDGTLVGQTYLAEPGADPLTFTVGGLTSGQSSSFTVSAVDLGLNESPPSAAVQAP